MMFIPHRDFDNNQAAWVVGVIEGKVPITPATMRVLENRKLILDRMATTLADRLRNTAEAIEPRLGNARARLENIARDTERLANWRRTLEEAIECVESYLEQNWLIGSCHETFDPVPVEESSVWS